jgi:preprotein translocase subunit SecF
MEFFRIKRDIPFMRHALVFNIISFLTFAAAVFFLVTRGLHFSIEFTGGSLIEVQYAQTANLAWGKSRCRTSAPRATCSSASRCAAK